MSDAINGFIYQPNVILEILLLLALLASVVKPRLLTVLATVILLVRPNERMNLGVPFMQVLIPLLLFVTILNLPLLKSKVSRFGVKYLLYLVSYVLLMTLVLHQSDFKYTFLYIGVGLLLFLTTIMFMDDDSGVKLFSCAIIFSCFLICLEPIYYHFTEPQGSELWNLFHSYKYNRLQAWGMWGNANETAFIACVGVASLLFLALRQQSRPYYAVSAAMIPFFLLVVFLTASRAGLASLLLVFMPIVILIRSMPVRIITITVIVASVAFAHSLAPERTDTERSSEDRSELRSRGLKLIATNPLLGVGFDKGRYEVGSKALHNTYIQAFAETGVIGGGLLVTYLFVLGRNLYGSLRSGMTASGRHHLIAVSGLYCSSLFYFFWGNQLLSILFFLVSSHIVLALFNTTRQPEPVEQSPELTPLRRNLPRHDQTACASNN